MPTSRDQAKMPRRVLSDSESDIMLSSSVHSDSKLEQGLRRAIADIFEAGNLSELTVKRVRLATENALGLEEGFFKGDANWKAKSDQIIKEEAVCVLRSHYAGLKRIWIGENDSNAALTLFVFIGGENKSARREETEG